MREDDKIDKMIDLRTVSSNINFLSIFLTDSPRNSAIASAGLLMSPTKFTRTPTFSPCFFLSSLFSGRNKTILGRARAIASSICFVARARAFSIFFVTTLVSQTTANNRQQQPTVTRPHTLRRQQKKCNSSEF